MMKSEIERSFLSSLESTFNSKGNIADDRYKSSKTFEERKEESTRILAKYMDRIPLIVEKVSKNDMDIDKKKFLVPNDFSVGQLMYVLRRRINLTPEKAMFIFIGNTIPNVSMSMNDIYANYRDEDGFLYLNYSTEESVFGHYLGKVE